MMPLPSQTHRGNGFVTRVGGIGRRHIALSADMKRLRLAAQRKDLEGKSTVIGCKHRDPKLLKALVHSLSAKAHPVRYCTAAAGCCYAAASRALTGWRPAFGVSILPAFNSVFAQAIGSVCRPPFALASRRPEMPRKERLIVEHKLGHETVLSTSGPTQHRFCQIARAYRARQTRQPAAQSRHRAPK